MKATRTPGFRILVLLSLAAACSSGSKGNLGSGGAGGKGGAGGADAAVTTTGIGGSSSADAGASTVVATCVGAPEYCVMFGNKTACQTVGCTWSESLGIQICEGVGSPCATFTTASACKFAGCTWETRVVPVGGRGATSSSGGMITNGGTTGLGGTTAMGGDKVDARGPEVPPRDAAPADAVDARAGDLPVRTPETRISLDAPAADAPGGIADAPTTYDLAGAEAVARDLAPAVDALPALTKLEIGPACAQLEVGGTFSFKAWGTTASASKIDVTAQVAWVSSKPGVATFSTATPGLATGIAAGDFEISVTGGGQSATLPARVAAWTTTKLDNDAEPKDFHVMTTSLGATPDRAGLAVAAWLVPDGTSRVGVAYREYDPATATWSAAATLDTGTTGEVVDVRMRVGPTGDLLALWQLHFQGGNTYEVWSTDRVAGVWRAPVRISTQGSTLDEMSLSMNHSGTAMAVWDEGLDPNETTRVAVYNSTQGWLTPVSIAGASVEAQIDYDDTNHALALWSGQGLQSRHYRAARGGWETTTSTVSSKAAYYPGLASEGQGAYLATWAEAAPVTGSKDRIVWVSRYTPDTGWTGLTYYGWDGTEANFPSIAGNWSSGSVVAWEQYLGSGADWDMYAAFCPVGGKCDSSVSLGFIKGSSPQGRAAVAVHKSGAAVVVWSGLDGLNLSRYYPGLGWAKTQRAFADHDKAHPWNPRAFIDDNCRVFVSWKEDGANLYTPYAGVFR